MKWFMFQAGLWGLLWGVPESLWSSTPVCAGIADACKCMRARLLTRIFRDLRTTGENDRGGDYESAALTAELRARNRYADHYSTRARYRLTAQGDAEVDARTAAGGGIEAES